MEPLEWLGLSPDAAEAYVRLLHLGALPAEQVPPVIRSGLQDVGLAYREGDEFRPTSPRQPLEAWAAERLRDAATARHRADALSELYDQRPGAGRLAVEVIHGADAVRQAGRALEDRTEAHLRMWDRAPYLNASTGLPEQQVDAMSRGVVFRTVYEGRSLAEPAHMARLRKSVADGEVARIHPTLPMKMMLADNREGIIALPAETGKVEALLITSSLLLAALDELFEMVWNHAIPVDPRPTTVEPSDAETEPSDESLQLLAALTAGLSDAGVARHLGISERTVHRRINRLQEMLGANGRFQLGVQAVRRGWI